MPGAPSGADMRFVKREWARYESMLGAINDPTSLEAAVAKRAHKRLAEIAAEVKLSNTNVAELANQVHHHSWYWAKQFTQLCILPIFMHTAHAMP